MKRYIAIPLVFIFGLLVVAGNALASLIDIEGVVMAFPEPVAMLLLGSGLVGISVIGRRKFIKK
jgi:hypothetical protein